MTVGEFVLSQDVGDVQIESDSDLIGEWRWMPLIRNGTQYLALNVIAGEAAVSPLMEIGHDVSWVYHLMQSLETLSSDGLVAELFFRSDSEEAVLLEIPMLPGQWREISATFSLGFLAGRTGKLGIRCKPGPLGDPSSDWLAIVSWVVGREDRLGLLNARAHRSWRMKNEIAVFDTVYDHPMYAARNAADEANGVVEFGPKSSSFRDPNLPMPLGLNLRPDDLSKFPFAQVRPGEDVFNYASRLLNELLGAEEHVNFSSRLKTFSAVARPVRVLSLCSGAAGIERGLLKDTKIPVAITLFDINEKLMRQAAAALSPLGPVRQILGDVNEISMAQFEDDFDIVVCVSGLHHVVELEIVVGTIFDLLTEDGEFWMVGEQIGRNGNRLWPEAASAANNIFSGLPDALRLNARTGQADSKIPDIDFSASCFEGIRSSEVERVVESFFDPVQVSRRNCFLWRVFENAYFENYDLSHEAHRAVVLEFVSAEYNLWRRGGRPTEIFGAYKRNRRGEKLRDLLKGAS